MRIAQTHSRDPDVFAHLSNFTQGMTWPGLIFIVAQIAVGITATLYPMLAVIFARKWRGEALATATPDDRLPPLTLLRPIKSGVPALAEKLSDLAKAMRAGDRLVLGVDDASPEAAIGEAIRAEFAERDIVLVRCRADAALNPKISKLVQMESAATGEYLVLSDSEAMIDAAWLDAFRREWVASGADVMTCGYRFARAASLPQALDAEPTLCSLWPGLFFVNRFTRLTFTLGACTALRRSDLARVGGWAAFSEELAEDNRLGSALAKAGCTIRLSQQVATLDSDPMTWRAYWQHQRRVAVTYRVCDPAGFAGMIFTHSAWIGLSLILFSSTVRESFGPLFVGWIFATWLQMAFGNGLAKTLGISRSPIPFAGLFSDLVETLCWLLAWLSPRVWWAGKWWRVSRDGKLREA